MPRPNKFNADVAAKIIKAIHGGSTVTAACKRAGVRRTTFLGHAKRQGFTHIVEQAKLAGEKRRSAKPVVAQGAVSAVPPDVPNAQALPEGPNSAEPRIFGRCDWTVSANDAALNLFVKIAQTTIDSLKTELRARGVEA